MQSAVGAIAGTAVSLMQCVVLAGLVAEQQWAQNDDNLQIKDFIIPKGTILQLEDSALPLVMEDVQEADIRIAMEDWTAFPLIPLTSTKTRQNGFVQGLVCVALCIPWLLSVVVRYIWCIIYLKFWKRYGVFGARKFGVDSGSIDMKLNGYWKLPEGVRSKRKHVKSWVWITNSPEISYAPHLKVD